MEPEKQSSKIDPRIWPSLTALISVVTIYITRITPAETTAPRSIEAEAERVADKAAEKVAERATDNPVELQVRALSNQLDAQQKSCDLNGALVPLLWNELYETRSRLTQLEARVRQPKNATAAGDALLAYDRYAGHWREAPATSSALFDLRQKQPLHKAAVSALQSIKVIVER